MRFLIEKYPWAINNEREVVSLKEKWHISVGEMACYYEKNSN